MNNSALKLALCVAVFSVVAFAVNLRHSVSLAQGQWQDTPRTAKGSSRQTMNNDNVRYHNGCPAASDDGKWCADVVEIVVEIGQGDPEELYRLKYFQETQEACSHAVRIASGPIGWASTVDCKFDPTLRRFVLHEKGWTKPQSFVSEITIQERVPAPKKPN